MGGAVSDARAGDCPGAVSIKWPCGEFEQLSTAGSSHELADLLSTPAGGRDLRPTPRRQNGTGRGTDAEVRARDRRGHAVEEDGSSAGQTSRSEASSTVDLAKASVSGSAASEPARPCSSWIGGG